VLIAPHEHSLNYLSVYSDGTLFPSDIEGATKVTKVGNDVWIGANVFIKRGTKVGDGAVIGAGSIVIDDVPAYSIVAGVPAKIIRFRFDKKIVEELLALKWWELDENLLASMDLRNIDKCITQLKELRRR
jgi:acetyltransferase-like isoleucine patch superfamily enzyme